VYVDGIIILNKTAGMILKQKEAYNKSVKDKCEKIYLGEQAVVLATLGSSHQVNL